MPHNCYSGVRSQVLEIKLGPLVRTPFTEIDLSSNKASCCVEYSTWGMFPKLSTKYRLRLSVFTTHHTWRRRTDRFAVSALSIFIHGDCPAAQFHFPKTRLGATVPKSREWLPLSFGYGSEFTRGPRPSQRPYTRHGWWSTYLWLTIYHYNYYIPLALPTSSAVHRRWLPLFLRPRQSASWKTSCLKREWGVPPPTVQGRFVDETISGP